MPINSGAKRQKKKIIKDPISNRLNRIGGQIDGIKRMYEDEDNDCVSVVTQIQAARGALGEVARILLTDEAKRCADKGDIKELKRVVSGMYKSI